MTPAHEVEIRWADLDGFGHVSHRAYIDFLEEARNAFLDAAIGADRRSTASRSAGSRSTTWRSSPRPTTACASSCASRVVGAGEVTTAEEVYSAADGRLAVRATCVLTTLDAATIEALRAVAESPAQHG